MRTAPRFKDVKGPEHFYVLAGPYPDLEAKVRKNARSYPMQAETLIADIRSSGTNVAAITYGTEAEGRYDAMALAWKVGEAWYVTPPIQEETKNYPFHFAAAPVARSITLGPDGLLATEIRASLQFRKQPPFDVVVVCIEAPKPACTRQFSAIGASYPGDGRIVTSSDARTETFEPFRK